jgi:pentapeptide MXKDX repeat protein
MKRITQVLIAACLALTGTVAFAQGSGTMSHDTMSHDAMSKSASSSDAMKHDNMSKDTMGHDSKMNHAASDTMGK